jgi:hypothetical protein
MADGFTAMLTERVIQIIAENKIQAAIEAGEFNNLPGLGTPAAIFDEPDDPNWWIRRKLKRESILSVFEKTDFTTEAQRITLFGSS